MEGRISNIELFFMANHFALIQTKVFAIIPQMKYIWHHKFLFSNNPLHHHITNWTARKSSFIKLRVIGWPCKLWILWTWAMRKLCKSSNANLLFLLKYTYSQYLLPLWIIKTRWVISTEILTKGYYSVCFGYKYIIRTYIQFVIYLEIGPTSFDMDIKNDSWIFYLRHVG